MASLIYYNAYGNNFGDQMTKDIIGKIVGSEISSFDISKLQREEIEKIPEPRLVTQGSIFHITKENDTIWGTGVNPIWHKHGGNFPKLDIRAVRGPLTRMLIKNSGENVCPEVYGDPSLLLPALFPELKPKPVKNKILVIPHFQDKNSEEISKTRANKNYTVIDASNDWKIVLKEILESELVISSSLHGIICAEAFKVPARWLYNNNLVSSVSEGTFKYNDYFLSTGRSTDDFASSTEEALKIGTKEPIINFDKKKLLESFPFELFNITEERKQALTEKL